MPPPPCPACASLAASYARGAEGRGYSLCPACGLVCLDPEDRLPPAEERERYLLHDNGPGNEGYAAYLTGFIESAISPFAPAGSRILDYGSGPYPLLSRILSERGFETCAWDPLFSPVPPDPRRRFDLVVAHEVLEHCSRPLDALNDMAARLSPGGSLSVSTLFRPAEPEAFLAWWYRQDSTHVSFFSEACLSGLCARARLEKTWSDGRSRAVFRLRAF